MRGLALVFLPEAHQVVGAFLVGETGQVFLAARVGVVLQQRYAVVRLLVGHVTHQVAHQADERQVDRLAQCILEGRVAAVVFLAEVVEHVHAAAGEEGFAGVGRILAFQRRVEHGVQALVLAVQRQPFQRPLADAVEFGDFNFLQLGGGHASILVVQLGDDLQVGGEHPQLGGGAQLQLAAFVDVEGLVGAVGLHPDPRAIGGAFEQGEAVAHLVGGLGSEQPLADQADLCGKRRVGKVFQVLADLQLQVGLQGTGG
ncbi:hypothetical protein D9M71_383900 [compost metagenome]